MTARKPQVLSEDELFKSMTESAFEFLRKAIEEFKASAKFSTVHFAIAIELFLKARLMREHWALLLDKPDNGDRSAFFKGESKTVSPEQTLDRLKKIAGVNIPGHSRDIFLNIAKHRNKMVHFVHSSDGDDPGATAQIVAEQCQGWLSLRVLLETWPEFEKFSGHIWQIARAMESHREFLQAKFVSMADVIETHRKNGKRVSICPSCNFEAVCVEEPHGCVSPSKCVVCWYAGSEIEIECIDEDCAQIILFNSYEMAPQSCPSCRTMISEDFLREALETGEGVHSGNYFEHVYINCAQCTGYHTGAEHHDIYICVQCLDTADKIGICGYCSEAQMGGVHENSYLVGCEACEGAIGNMRDD